MRKETLYGKEAREKIMSGVRKIVNAIKVTLGPAGRNVIISKAIFHDYAQIPLPLHITKDGVTVAHAFELDDHMERPGVLLVKEACQKTVDQAGDGTTTCAVLLEAIATLALEKIDAGANPMELKRGIDEAVRFVVEKIAEMATPLKGDIERIRQIATVSANHDAEIGDMIAQAVEKIGTEGVIDIQQSNSVKTEIKLTDGIKLDRGWISPYFVTHKERQVCEFDEPYILLYDKRVIHAKQVEQALKIATGNNRPLLIICEDCDEQGLAFLNINVARGLFRACAIKAPGFAESRREQMEDIAVLTGATFVSDLKGINIENVSMAEFGTAKKVIVSKDETIIIDGGGKVEQVEHLKNELRTDLHDNSKSDEEKKAIERRLARLSGSIAVVNVGGATETEMKERYDRFDDAVRATKAAIAEGFVPGGGTAFLRVDFGVTMYNPGSFADGVNVVLEATKTPLKQICANAGVTKDIAAAVYGEKENIGYNAKSDRLEDLVKSGIIDPAKVLRCALQNAASAAGMLITCEAEISDTV